MKRVLAVCALGAWTMVSANPDGAPPAHTGAFGEPSCHACHFDGPAREPGGPVRLHGLPARLEAGETYELVLELEARAASAGFQFTVRDRQGRQAGSLSRADGATRTIEHDEIQYLGHTDTSSRRWRFTWRAPDEPRTVVFAGSVNAANDDRSAFGDEIYLIEQLMEMERSR